MKRKSIVFFLFLIGALGSCLTNNTFDSIAQLKSDTTTIRNYLRDNGIIATKTSQGVWFSLKDTSAGFYPALADSVKIVYTATLLTTGKVVATSATSKSPALTVLLSSVISGMQVGLLRFPVGSTGKLYIPSGLAFGPAGRDSIPANSNLIYDITLKSASGTRLIADKSAIDSYITSIGGTTIQDATGIRYSYDVLDANGTNPKSTSRVVVDYSLKLINGTSAEIKKSVADTTVKLSEQIAAWKTILPKITVNSTVKIYSPSGYAYGSWSPSTSIPANSNLIYEIKLKGVK